VQKSICHYSFHRTWKEKNWDCEQLGNAVKKLGVDAVDFHAGMLKTTDGAVDLILSTLKKTGLVLSGLSLSNNFNQEEPEELRKQIHRVVEWIRVAAQVQAPVSRIFGGSLSKEQRTDAKIRKEKLSLIVDSLGEVTKAAEKEGVVLALENHGGLPCTGEEQVEVIKAVNSNHLRATIDVGNYLSCGQEGHVGTEIAAPYVAYVHLKDFKKLPDPSVPFGRKLQACIVGTGSVDLRKCLDLVSKAGYTGFVALEFEGVEGEEKGIPGSITCMNKILTP